MNDFKYNIKKELAVLDEWNKVALEVNVISFGDGGKPKLDIRKWNISENKMLKGISLTKEETIKLQNVLNSLDYSIFEDNIKEEYKQSDDNVVIKIKKQ